MAGDYVAPILVEPKGGGSVPRTMRRPRNVRNAIDPRDIDLSGVQADFERHLEQILSEWSGITRRQVDQIIDQVKAAVSAGDLKRLAKLSVSTKDAEEALLDSMSSMALTAAQRVVDEAASQGANIDPVASDRKPFGLIAATAAGLLAGALANAAGREALRRWTPGMDAEDLSRGVRDHLESLSDSFTADNLGGALSHAETTGRMNTMMSGPSAALYASEVLDANTCGPCHQINGKWLGNSDEPGIEAKIAAIYPRGYVGCLGRDRCRGQVVSIWRQAGEGFVGATVEGGLDE
jgi:hypothetical protein